MYTVQTVVLYKCGGKSKKLITVLYSGDNAQLANRAEFDNTLSYHTVKVERKDGNKVVSIIDKQY